jgi:hypothetical protein
MQTLGRSRLGVRLAVCAAMLAPSALAHIDLRVPVPREQGLSLAENANLKLGPCGQVNNGRTERVTVFAPNDTIEVTWAETTNHRSYYRVAFDRDGDDDFPAFAGPGIGTEGIDPRSRCPVDGQVILAYEMEDGAGGLHTLRVRLPDVECERCTLQVIQYMFDRMRPYYFQCADLALRRSLASDAGVLDAGVDRGPVAAPAAAVSPADEPRAAAACSSRIAPTDAGLVDRDRDDTPEREATPSENADETAASGMLPAPAAAPASTVERSASGCSLGTMSGQRHGALGLLCAASLVGRRLWRRRAPRRD